jgi:hypothetical protein
MGFVGVIKKVLVLKKGFLNPTKIAEPSTQLTLDEIIAKYKSKMED